jgi:hypothetical protein
MVSRVSLVAWCPVSRLSHGVPSLACRMVSSPAPPPIHYHHLLGSTAAACAPGPFAVRCRSTPTSHQTTCTPTRCRSLSKGGAPFSGACVLHAAPSALDVLCACVTCDVCGCAPCWHDRVPSLRSVPVCPPPPPRPPLRRVPRAPPVFLSYRVVKCVEFGGRHRLPSAVWGVDVCLPCSVAWRGRAKE